MDKSEILDQQMVEKRKHYKGESYGMSIGEFANMYLSDEVIINPDFQRNFRWSDLQKTRLIESIFLGIPIPPIFVYQDMNGIWEVVDGLQRLSTILQFMGIHKTESPLILSKAPYLDSLYKCVWEKDDTVSGDIFELSPKQKLEFKRSKITLTIILNESDADAKYDVFERLNTGGSFANPQEVRNSMLIMRSKQVYQWLNDLSDNNEFLELLNLNDRLLSEKYNMELALRAIALLNFEFNQSIPVSDYLDHISKKLIETNDEERIRIGNEFTKIFHLLYTAVGESPFRRFENEKFKGKFLESYYEFIVIGIGKNITNINELTLKEKIQKLSSFRAFTDNMGAGSNLSVRVPAFLKSAPVYFSGEE